MSHIENRRVLQGVVSSDAMERSCTVLVEAHVKHPRYKKYIKRSKKYMAHDQNNQCGVGDTVEIVQTRPLSKRKNWAVLRIVEKAV